MKKKSLGTMAYVMIALLALLLIFIPYYFFVHKPVTDGIVEANNRIEECNNQVALLTAKQVKMKQMQTEVEARKTDASVATVQMYDNQSDVMDFLYDVLLKRTTELNVRQSIAYPKDGYVVRRTMNISFRCSSYLAAADIVSRLEASTFLNQITVMAISPVSKTIPGTNEMRAVTSGQVEVNLSVVFFEDYSESSK